MFRRFLYFTLVPSVLFVMLAAVGPAEAQGQKGAAPAPPPARKIPGITAKDVFPRGCVDCHINRPDTNKDTRISTLMRQWNEKVEPKFLAKMQAFAPEGRTLKGKHPAAAASLRNIPAGCLPCHGKTSKLAPPFLGMLHAIHLAGGEENEFLTLFQGECTHCHKLNLSTGQSSLPSGPER